MGRYVVERFPGYIDTGALGSVIPRRKRRENNNPALAELPINEPFGGDFIFAAPPTVVPDKVSATYPATKTIDLLSEEVFNALESIGYRVSLTRGFRGRIVSAHIEREDTTSTPVYHLDRHILTALSAAQLSLSYVEAGSVIRYGVGGQFGNTKNKVYVYPQHGVIATTLDNLVAESIAAAFDPADFMSLSSVLQPYLGDHVSLGQEKTPIAFFAKAAGPDQQDSPLVYFPDANVLFRQEAEKSLSLVPFTHTERPQYNVALISRS